MYKSARYKGQYAINLISYLYIVSSRKHINKCSELIFSTTHLDCISTNDLVLQFQHATWVKPSVLSDPSFSLMLCFNILFMPFTIKNKNTTIPSVYFLLYNIHLYQLTWMRLFAIDLFLYLTALMTI